jgi:hypothetical protein
MIQMQKEFEKSLAKTIKAKLNRVTEWCKQIRNKSFTDSEDSTPLILAKCAKDIILSLLH